MKLRIVTPLAVVLDEDGISALRAEDASGGFGILPGHADFLTRLAISTLNWQGRSGGRRYCAVRGGVLTVAGGDTISVASREAVLGDDPLTLHETVLGRFRADVETERTEHVESARLHLNAIRQILRNLRPDQRRGAGLFS